MAFVIHKMTAPVSTVPVTISIVVIAVKSAILIVQMSHVMDMVAVQTMIFHYLVTSVCVTWDLLVQIVKQTPMTVKG